MSRSSTGTVMLATTADMLQAETISIIAVTANMTTVRTALLTVVAVMNPVAWVVPNNVPTVKTKSV